MPVLVTYNAVCGADPVPMADAMIRCPSAALLGHKRVHPALESAVENLRDDVRTWLEGAASLPQGGAPTAVVPEPAVDGAEIGLRRLRETSERMRDPAMRGEALSIVLEFASESFSRVAIFMVRDDRAVGIAQIGLPSTGGPEDDAFRMLEIDVDEIDCFQSVIDTRRALSVKSGTGGIVSLTELLGDQEPSEAYLAPIESGGRVVALLYADQLPALRPIGDTTIVEIVLHEAGLALERALLERALARAGEAGAD